MTGFGAAEGEAAGGRLQIEVRTVNHRFLSIAVKLANEVVALEPELRERIRQAFHRGHVTVHLRWLDAPRARATLQLDPERAREAMARLRELQTAVGLSGEIPLDLLSRQPDVFRMTEERESAVSWEEVAPVLDDAIAACLAMRQREGEVLAEELIRRLAALGAGTDAVETIAPERLARERDRLRASVTELMGSHSADENRLIQELALMADKLDVTEELVRLRSHLASAEALLEGNGAIGKELGFLAQEIGREVNTIGAKANDGAMVRRVIGMKGELEKFREQLENLE